MRKTLKLFSSVFKNCEDQWYCSCKILKIKRSTSITWETHWKQFSFLQKRMVAMLVIGLEGNILGKEMFGYITVKLRHRQGNFLHVALDP